MTPTPRREPVVPRQERTTMTQDPRRPVVVGVDASDAALRATGFAADEARRRQAPLLIVHAISWPFDSLTIPPTDLDTAGQVRAGAARVTQWAADAVAGDDLEIQTSVEEGDPVAVLRAASADAVRRTVTGSPSSTDVLISRPSPAAKLMAELAAGMPCWAPRERGSDRA